MGFQSRKIEYLEDRSTRLTCSAVRHGNHIRPVPTCLTGFLVVQLNSSLLKFYGRHHDLVNRCIISVSQWSRICSVCSNHNPVLSSFMANHRVSNKNNTTDATCGAGTIYPFEVAELTRGIYW